MRPTLPTDPSHSPTFRLAEIPVPMVYATHRIIRDCNDAFAGLFGFTRAELLDQSFSKLYPKLADFIRTGEMWRSNLAGAQVYHDERIMIGAGGKRFWCRVTGRTRNNADPFAGAIYCFELMARPVSADVKTLTDRQRQILALVAQGKTSAVIAKEIGISKRTAETHRMRLLRKVGVGNSSELMTWFAINGA